MSLPRKQFLGRSILALAIALTATAVGIEISARAGRVNATVPSPWADVESVSIDVAIRHSRIRTDGGPVPIAAAPITYRLERRKSGDAWRTAIVRLAEGSLPGLDGRPIRIARPHGVARIEVDENSQMPRFFDGNGRELKIPTEKELLPLLNTLGPRPANIPLPERRPGAGPTPASATKKALSGSEWLSNLMIPKAGRDRRQQRLISDLGPAAGTVRGYKRHLKSRGDEVTEVLVDQDTMLPVEINVAKANSLLSQSTLTYDVSGDFVLRKKIRTETRSSSRPSEREVAEIEFSNFAKTMAGGGK